MFASWPCMLRVSVTVTCLPAACAADLADLAAGFRAGLPSRFAVRLADFLAHAHQALPRMSSTLLPRLAAMSSGERTLASALTVARTTLIGLREP